MYVCVGERKEQRRKKWVLISALQQSDSVIHFFLIFFSIMVNHRILNIVLCEGMYIVFKNIMLLNT